MAEKMQKTRTEPNRHSRDKLNYKRTHSKFQTLAPINGGAKKRKNEEIEGRKRKSGPRLLSRFRKEIDSLNPAVTNSDEEIDSDVEAADVYEYEEGVPEEESKKNKRFDLVENFEYELPDDFKDENIQSDDDIEGSDDNDGADGGCEISEDSGNEAEEEDEGRHARMLQGITGLPIEAFEGKKKKNNAVVSEAYPESEYNPSRDVLDGGGKISIQDLLDPLHGKAGYSKLRKRTHDLDKKSVSVLAPLPKADRERLERKVAYEQSKKDISKWEQLIKRNREASTITFDENIDLGVSTVGGIASEFRPRTEFEKKMAAIVHDKRVVEAHRNDGAKLLEMNKVSIEDVKKSQNLRAKMRSLLFLHEIKAKKIKKIKSKTYHRLLKKDRLKSASAVIHLDPESAKENAMKQEFKRAEERLTLKHKNKSKWAKRILQRGLSAQDEGTRTAIAEQLHEHTRLTRKMKSMKDGSSSSDDSSDDDDDDDEASAASDPDVASKVIAKAKAKTLKVLEGEDEIPTSGLLSLPFMVRGMKRRKEAAHEEAKLALKDYDLSMKQLEDTNAADLLKESNVSSGRRVFGAAKKQAPKPVVRTKPEIDYGCSSDEDKSMAKENVNISHQRSNDSQKDVDIDANLFREESEIEHDHLFKSFQEVVANPGPKATYEVAILAPCSGKKIKNSEADRITKNSPKDSQPGPHNQYLEQTGEDSDSESEIEMVDGILTATTKLGYELPSQSELIRRAFAGDNVEDDFDKDKQEILNEENPEPEKPTLLPGWGQWTDIQKKRGLPTWMVREHDNAKKKREEALKLRKDAHLTHVIISEKFDKKTEKLHTKTLPFPYTSKEIFEQSIRTSIGPEFNPASTVRALNRPDVLKRSGIVIQPIKYEDVNAHENTEEHKHGNAKQKSKQGNRGKNQNKHSYASKNNPMVTIIVFNFSPRAPILSFDPSFSSSTLFIITS